MAEKKDAKDGKDEKVAVKRRPGRPPKNQMERSRMRGGIRFVASRPTYQMEFMYDMPSMFKKVWGLFKSMSVAKVQAIYQATNIMFYAMDHFNKHEILVRIDCTRVNRYFLHDGFEIGLSGNALESIMNKITSDYREIVMVSTRESKDRKINITIVPPVSIDEYHSVELIGEYPKLGDDARFRREGEYTISMRMPGKYLKKMVNDIKSSGARTISLRQYGQQPPLFRYTAMHGRIIGENRLHRKEDFKIVSHVKDDEQFRTDINLVHLRSLFSALPADIIDIHAHQKMPLLSTLCVDGGAIEIRILTTIEDYSLDS